MVGGESAAPGDDLPAPLRFGAHGGCSSGEAQGGGAAALAELPVDFVERMVRLLGGEADEFLASLGRPEAGLRVNTLRISPERFEAEAPFPVERLAFPPEGFLVDPGAEAGRHPYHAAGVYYLQDPGAMAVGGLVAPVPRERVLDLAAAPGGKATHLGARLAGQGVLVANDLSPARARELVGNLERLGVRNSLVTTEPVERLADRLAGWFDRVLLDAPCSGESMFHKSAAARNDWSPASVAGCSRRQAGLLEAAGRLVRPGGLLVYSTCTFAPEENEQVVADLLATGGWRVETLEAVPGASPGRPDWAGSGAPADLARTVRLWPHRTPGAGHYVAGLRRLEAAAGPTRPRAPGSGARREEHPVWEAFRREQLPDLDLVGWSLFARGDELHALPPDAPELDGLRATRPGWWLGTLRKGRFVPSHALAMGLSPHERGAVLDIAAVPEEVSAYLRGEALRSPGPSGWTLVTVAGHPLGWGKRVGSVLKNHLPKGLRRR